MEKWTEIRKGADFKKIGQKFGIDPLVARVMVNRGISDDEAVRKYLYGTLDDLEDPLLLEHITDAAVLLHQKIDEEKKIRVIGDYDIDGVCATYILTDTLRRAGADVSYAIPERMKDGYGLNIRLVEEAVQDGIDTILTCDNGISAKDQIRYAKDRGLTVIVTDHHEPLYEDMEDGGRRYLLPDADVCINPKLPGSIYPNPNLCGAATAWKLMYVYEGLEMLAASGSLPSEDSSRGTDDTLPPLSACAQAMRMLPFAAFATVGDVMDLTGENRILVKEGLKLLPRTDNIGMQSLIAACSLSGKDLTSYHIGFVLGPCVNAGGRLETALVAEELFLTRDIATAKKLSAQLKELNDERRNLTETGRQMAEEKIGGKPFSEDRVLLIYLPGTHESIVGIIAGKIREQTGKPTIILTDAREEGMLKGSGRSIPEYSMFDELVKCSSLLEKFGGHPMAAGLSLKKENYELLRIALNEHCTLTEEDTAIKVRIDARLPLNYISETLVRQLSLIQPCGKGNEKPAFAQSGMKLLSCRILGKNRNVLKFEVQDSSGCRMKALYFSGAEELCEKMRQLAGEEAVRNLMYGADNPFYMTAAFYPDVNEFRGVKELQIVISSLILSAA